MEPFAHRGCCPLPVTLQLNASPARGPQGSCDLSLRFVSHLLLHLKSEDAQGHTWASAPVPRSAISEHRASTRPRILAETPPCGTSGPIGTGEPELDPAEGFTSVHLVHAASHPANERSGPGGTFGAPASQPNSSSPQHAAATMPGPTAHRHEGCAPGGRETCVATGCQPRGAPRPGQRHGHTTAWTKRRAVGTGAEGLPHGRGNTAVSLKD